MAKEIIDTHAHFVDTPDWEGAIERAQNAGVTRIVAMAMDFRSALATLEAAGRFPGVVFPAIGMHPWTVGTERVDPLLDLMNEHRARLVAVGEIGLDAKIDAPMEEQVKVFKRMLAFARDAGLPVSIHSRRCGRETFDLVREMGIEAAVFHWFSGRSAVVRDIVDAGFMISVTPAVARGPAHRNAVSKTPLERLLLESDCPVPWGHGEPSEPNACSISLDELARFIERPPELVAKRTTANALRTFPRLTRPPRDEPRKL